MADLTLAYREFMFMKQLLRNKKIGLARLLSHSSRYVDDINIVNYKNFSNIIKEIKIYIHMISKLKEVVQMIRILTIFKYQYNNK